MSAPPEAIVTDYKYVIRLPREMGERLQRQAHLEDRPIARVVRHAIADYLERWPEGRP